jgi:hypothetical protein
MEGRVEYMRGEWSERLVPVGEVLNAYNEGLIETDWEDSRARRVIEGKEEV